MQIKKNHIFMKTKTKDMDNFFEILAKETQFFLQNLNS
jgi:hypothetical protein